MIGTSQMIPPVDTPNGFIASGSIHYYVKDYQGNVRQIPSIVNSSAETNYIILTMDVSGAIDYTTYTSLDEYNKAIKQYEREP
ncbi:MAG: hypothetical protein K2K09_06480 [Lachnospiraceae bacterium]|nr:hypothetical protein [Lachnospiraceae bacterium]